ncbi:MAG: PAS domain S-box protein [Chloroflexi bacterium]|nr:PAS domain S-box protein [Chloroflexota bacterium]
MNSLDVQGLTRRIVELAPDAVIAADSKGTIQLWNAGAEAIFGYTADEALGQTLDLIVPERQRERHWAGFFKVVESGVTKYGARDLLSVPASRKDGARISIEFSIVLLRDRQGRTEGIAAIVRDVTARWQQERELRQRLATLEAQAASRSAP